MDDDDIECGMTLNKSRRGKNVLTDQPMYEISIIVYFLNCTSNIKHVMLVISYFDLSICVYFMSPNTMTFWEKVINQYTRRATIVILPNRVSDES